MSLKNPVTTPGIDPGTVRLVAQRLNHYATPMQTLFITSQESEIADRAIRSDLLSMERLLVHTIYVRTRSRLTELKQELQTMLKDVECKYHCLLGFFLYSFCHVQQFCIKNLLLGF